jgi:hypothetical protein
MQDLYNSRFKKDNGGVCTPALSWRIHTDQCDCQTSAEAFALSQNEPEKVNVLPNGKCPSVEELVAKTMEVALSELQQQSSKALRASEIRDLVEDKLRVPLFSARKIIQAVVRAVVSTRDLNENPVDSAEFQVNALASLADSETKMKHPYCGPGVP